MPALALYTSLGFVPEKRLHRFYLNGKDAFRLVLPLGGSEDTAATLPCKKQFSLAHLPLLSGASDDDSDETDSFSAATTARRRGAGMGPALASSMDGDDDYDYDYAEDTAKLLRLQRRVAALRSCRMITVWPADDDDRVSGR